ncbi:MAG: D-alanyl-D-alanine carboxypeptidase/D-alanyl-D-alanine endopeptidase [Nocardioides sp.]
MSRTGSRRLLAVVAPLALVLLAGSALWGLGWVDHWRGHDRVAATPEPRALAVRLPTPAASSPIAAPAGGALRAARIRQVLAAPGRSALGRHVVAAVAGLTGPLVASRGSGAAIPASTTKLLTAAAVLALDGPEKRFTTRTVLTDSAGADTVTLVGGGDPLLAAGPPAVGDYPHVADLTTLAKQTASALRAHGVTSIRLRYDTSLFTGPDVAPTWPESYLAEGVVAPISPLWVDEGRTVADNEATGRVADPAKGAAAAFATALGSAGVRIHGRVSERPAPAGSADLAHVDSPPLREIVDHVLEVSDNEGAEVLAHQAGLASGDGGSFAGGAAAVRAALGKLGVDTAGLVLDDGSGLSRANRIAPATLVGVLQQAAAQSRLAPIVTSVPVAGFSGSLYDRFDDADGRTGAGRGLVRAKTGTLTGVDALAGYTQDASGAPVVFAIMADRVAVTDTLEARHELDSLATALTVCRCG